MSRSRYSPAKLPVLAAALATCLAIPALAAAQDQVTVVMRNGERVSGRFEDLNANTVYVRASLHDQRRLPLDGIAVLDFGGDAQNLPDAERNEAAGGDHLLVMRSGARSRGRLLNIEGGEGSSKPNESRVISFRTANGEERRVRPGEVSRIYLGNFAQGATTSDQSAGSGLGTAAGPGVTVPGNQQWTRTGIFVRQGDTVRFTSSGEITLSTDQSDVATVAGSRSGRRAMRAPMGNALAGALIGRIGNGAPFGIGDQASVRMPESGELFLGINDDEVGDNRGSFQVEVVPQTPVRRRR